MCINLIYSDQALILLIHRHDAISICMNMLHLIKDIDTTVPYLMCHSYKIEWVNSLISNSIITYELFLKCCIYGHLEVVKQLIHQKDIDIRRNDYEPFLFACKYGHAETAEYLLNLLDSDEERLRCVNIDEDAIVNACENDLCDVVKCLVSWGFDIRVNDYLSFSFICMCGYLDIAKDVLNTLDDHERLQCIQCGDNCSVKSASAHGHFEMVKWLIDNGADIRAGDYSAFRVTCINGHFEIAKYLLNLITDEDEKILCVTSNNNESVRLMNLTGCHDMLECLISHGADISSDEYRIFHRAFKLNATSTMRHILSLIKDEVKVRECINSRIDERLRYASRTNNIDNVKILVEYGFDVKSYDHMTIQKAIENGNNELNEDGSVFNNENLLA